MSRDAAQFRVIIRAMKFQRPVLRLILSSQFIVTAVMLLLLPLLAFLQYKWQGE
jgi:hypothetical protein